LYVASQEGHTEIVALLLSDKGINVNAANKVSAMGVQCKYCA
jgi:Ankyrin repeat